MLERATRWWLTKPNNWWAAGLWVGLFVLTAALAYWSYEATGSFAWPVMIALASYALQTILFVLVPLALGAHYGIEPHTRSRASKSGPSKEIGA